MINVLLIWSKLEIICIKGQLNILIEPGGQIYSNFSHSVAIDVKSLVESLQKNESDVANYILYTDNR